MTQYDRHGWEKIPPRTKHTEDVPDAIKIGLWDEVTEENRRMRLVQRLLGWALIIAVVALLAWVATLKAVEISQRDDRDRRIHACATAMASESARESAEVPIPRCESLSPSERREAAYVYAQREGLL